MALVIAHIRDNQRRDDGLLSPTLRACWRWALSTTCSAPPALLSLVAFVGLILAPALGSYGRPWEKFAAGFLSLFVLAALVLVGVVVGVLVFYNWDRLQEIF